MNISSENKIMDLEKRLVAARRERGREWEGSGAWGYQIIRIQLKRIPKYLRNLYTELPYDPAIPLLGIYLDKTSLKKTHAPAKT